jgi:hypothetical protein
LSWTVALSLPEETVNVPADGPFPVGVYCTAIPQLACAGNEDVQVLPTILNAGSPVIEAVGDAIALALAFVTPTVLTREDLPTAMLPKFALLIDNATAELLAAPRYT